MGRSDGILKPWLVSLLAALLLSPPLTATADPALPRLKLQAGAHTFQVEVAATPQQRQTGLMGRKSLADDAGMLFVFEHKDIHCFWMKNTPIPLSIAFLADDGSIVNIADMQPQTLDFHCAYKPVRYALEVKQGGFKRRGIEAGSRVTGGPFAQRN
jgi:uncharacterized membrane protein (UPF0127 family)